MVLELLRAENGQNALLGNSQCLSKGKLAGFLGPYGSIPSR